MKCDGTGWARRALTDADRLEILRTEAPEGTSVYFFGITAPRPPMHGKAALPGWYSACITQYPFKWYAEAASPIEAFRSARAEFTESVVGRTWEVPA